MILILMRHGEAEPEEGGVTNKERRLTEKGRKNAVRTAKILARFLKGSEPRILTSPYRRTKETAEIAADICGGSVTAAAELTQGAWRETAAHCIKDGTTLLVSHHPFLQSYLMTLCGAAIKFEPASAAVLDYDPQWKQAKLLGYFTPGIRKMKNER